MGITVTVPGPGVLEAAQASGNGWRVLHRAAKKKLIKPTSRETGAAGPVTLTIRPTKDALKQLKRESRGEGVGKLKVQVEFTFTPTGGTPASEVEAVKLKLSQ